MGIVGRSPSNLFTGRWMSSGPRSPPPLTSRMETEEWLSDRPKRLQSQCPSPLQLSFHSDIPLSLSLSAVASLLARSNIIWVQLTSLKSPQCFKCLKIGEGDRHRELAGRRVRETSERRKRKTVWKSKSQQCGTWTKKIRENLNLFKIPKLYEHNSTNPRWQYFVFIIITIAAFLQSTPIKLNNVNVIL